MAEFEYNYYDNTTFDLDTFFEIEKICKSLTQEVSLTIASLDYKIIGCSTNWEQNNCCIALINAIKKIQPDTCTLIGGSNCEAEMTEGIASLSPFIDYIFSGESEQTFADFLERYSTGKPPSRNIIEAQPVEDLDNIPLPDYDSYFTQLHRFLTHNSPKEIVIGYETSRGCWWGKCSFYGQNGKRVRFRQKAVTKVVRELGQINARHPQNRILLIDKVLPVTFHNALLPLLCEKEGASPISCEHRPDLSLRELMRLKKARFNIIKFGIEALSASLLKLISG